MSLSVKKCCVPGCLESERTHEVLQAFPDPVKDHNRFNTWIKSIGGDILSLENVHIYKYRRVCRAHFEAKYLCRFNRISNDAIPTLNMPAPTALQKFSNTEQRPLRRKQNSPSTSKCEYGMLSPSPTDEYLCDTPERLVTFKCYQRKPLTQIDNILISTMNDDPEILPSLVPSPPIETANMRAMDQNTSPSKNMTVVCSDGIPKRPRRQIARRTKLLTPAEINLYKKLVSTRIKLSKCRAKANKQLVTIKTAQNIMSNPKFLDIMENVSPAAKLITMMQLREHQKKDKGRRFSIKEKILALSIFKQSPKGYRFLRKLLILPEPQTLTKLINKANIKPGINNKIFKQLTKKAENMKVEERLCILIYDEMSLRAHLAYNERKDEVVGFATDGKLKTCDFADHAQVFMIRGLIKNYKQPISYTFSRSATKGIELAKQLKTTISEIQKTGLIVVATICDQGTNNRQAIKILLNEARASFLRKDEEPKDNIIIIDGYEIVPLYDPPHLLKCIRNNLLTKNLNYTLNDLNGTAKWSHLELLLKENPGYKGIRLIPKLTERHILANQIPKMKVKYASQVFSQAVANNMGYLADKKILPEECKQTADLLIFFDKLFDSVNGSYGKKEKHGKPLLAAVKPNSKHHIFWNEAKKALKMMNFVNKTTNKLESVPTLNNWAWTLSGVQLLLEKLKRHYDITSVWMRHLNQDPIENFLVLSGAMDAAITTHLLIILSQHTHHY